ncbi:MAG TPA: SRPBCC family protein [Bacteroidales bacterium]|nr:SRPBCC family protein [Bacteroidales bacterium]HPS16344.1 SRPBCC family protein [Bacteroidales bacterium]
MDKNITVETIINAPIEKVWDFWSLPEHIIKWNFASNDWHTPKATNKLHNGGKFNYRMEAKDGSFGFDFWGTYNKIITHKLISYTLGDGRKVEITFTAKGNNTEVIETFEAESTNPAEMQKVGWQAILDNFKKYVEAN